MNVGDTEYLNASITPSNASNKTVYWYSSNENVATVGLYTGKVTAKKAGTTTITAATADGGYTASCTVTVFIDTVTIQKDGAFNKVVFNKSGKVWRCINQDMVFDNDSPNTTISYRSNHNFYIYFDEDDWLNSDTTDYKRYTDDEIKLLFAIDPYGVCDYINRVGDRKNSVQDMVDYKDEIFRLLFNREPKYFARDLNGNWGEVDGYIEIDDVLSESETLFGGHRIWDDYTFLQALEHLISVIDLALSTIPQIRSVSNWLKGNKSVDNVVKIFSFIFGTLSDGIVSSTIDVCSPNELNGTSVSWANILVTNYMNLIEFLSDARTTPNCYARIFDYYINNLNYDINIEFSNGEIYELERIREALELSE